MNHLVRTLSAVSLAAEITVLDDAICRQWMADHGIGVTVQLVDGVVLVTVSYAGINEIVYDAYPLQFSAIAAACAVIEHVDGLLEFIASGQD